MASIKVFNPLNGKWSKSIMGVDRVFFIKSIVGSRFNVHNLYTDGKKTLDKEWIHLSKTYEDLKDRRLENIELDFKPIIYGNILDVRYWYSEDFLDDDGSVTEVEIRTTDPEKATSVDSSVSWDKVNLNPDFLTISVGRLKDLTEFLKENSLEYWIPLIEKIIEFGDIPSAASDDYTLILKFHD